MDYKNALSEIKKVHEKKIMLSKQEVSEITGLSISTLDRDIFEGVGIKYKKTRGRILYPNFEVAKWMTNLVKTA